METFIDEKKNRMEIILYTLAFIIAVVLRFLHLGVLPLGDSEAALALQALDAVRGNETFSGGQPVYVSLTALIFSVSSATGFWACFWPALAGSALVFTPLLFKDILGSRGSLLLAFLFSLDTGMVAVSRSASGSMITLVSFLAVLGFLHQKRSLWAGVFAGLFILGGSLSWSALIGAIILSMLFWILFGKKTKKPFFTGIDTKKLFTSLVATVLLVGTGLILFPSLINGLGTGFHEYFVAFVNGNGVSLKVMFVSLQISELLVLPLAIWGLIIGIKRRDVLSTMMGYGILIFALLCLLNQSRQVVDWVWTIIPITVLAAKGLEDIAVKFLPSEKGVTGVQAALTVILLVFSFLNLLGVINNPPVDTSSMRLAIIEVVLPLAFLVIVTLLMAFGWSVTGAKQGILVGFGMVLIFVSLGTTIKSAGLGPRPEFELWRSSPLPAGEDMLIKTTTELSLFSTGTENRIDIALLDAKSASLRWALHDYEKLSTIEFIGESDSPSIIISAADSQIGSSMSYRGQGLLWTISADYDNMSAAEWLRWFTYREAPGTNQNILLWARNDLFTGS